MGLERSSKSSTRHNLASVLVSKLDHWGLRKEGGREKRREGERVRERRAKGKDKEGRKEKNVPVCNCRNGIPQNYHQGNLHIITNQIAILDDVTRFRCMCISITMATMYSQQAVASHGSCFCFSLSSLFSWPLVLGRVSWDLSLWAYMHLSA